jgi:prepilin-type N-terminal cleavage/methylation domain-containing protein
MRGKNGFTLIELMIVIAIIAVLAAILIPNFLHARAESVTAACEGNEKQLATAEELYAVDNDGQYAAFSSLTTPYLSTMITDPVQPGDVYTITIPAPGINGAFEIDDSGDHDPTTTKFLRKKGGVVCTVCTSIVYVQASGIHGK